jgi:hypothetical protein
MEQQYNTRSPGRHLHHFDKQTSPLTQSFSPNLAQDGRQTCFFVFFFKEVARGGERTRVLSISFIFSFSPLYRWATAAPRATNLLASSEMGNKFVGQLKESGWLDYQLPVLFSSCILVTLKFTAGQQVCCPGLSWVTNLSPISCWIRTKRFGY